MQKVTITKAENGYIITDATRTWVSTSNYDISTIVERAFRIPSDVEEEI